MSGKTEKKCNYCMYAFPMWSKRCRECIDTEGKLFFKAKEKKNEE